MKSTTSLSGRSGRSGWSTSTTRQARLGVEVTRGSGSLERLGCITFLGDRRGSGYTLGSGESRMRDSAVLGLGVLGGSGVQVGGNNPGYAAVVEVEVAAGGWNTCGGPIKP